MENFKESQNTAKQSDFVPEGVFEANLTESQIGAIRHSIQEAMKIQTSHPEIAEDYKKGLVIDEIVNKYNLQDEIGDSYSQARNAVWFALRGYEPGIIKSIPAFQGLIPREEYDLVAEKHQADASAETGRHNREVGLRQLAEKKGIHAQSIEERRKLGKEGVIKQGSRPYEENEINLINELALQPEYQRKSRINAKKIAEELNRRLYEGKNVRTPLQIKKMRYRFKPKPKQTI